MYAIRSYYVSGEAFVRIDDILDETVPDDVALVEILESDSFDAREHFLDFHQSAHAARRKIDLRDVARNDCAGIRAHAREKHLHLHRRGVLRLVQNDEGVVERAAAHVCQRNDLDRPPLDT